MKTRQTKDSMDMLSPKRKKLKLQKEKLLRNLSGKLKELEAECSQALASGSKKAQCKVALTLNRATEFIKTLDTKVDDFCPLSEEDGREIKTESEMKASLSELTGQLKDCHEKIKSLQSVVKEKEELVKAKGDQVQKLKDSYDALSTQLTQVSEAPVGFTTYLSESDKEVMPDSEVGGILEVHSNRGNCYKEQEGHFVAPCDGLYGFYFRVKQNGKVAFKLSLLTEGGSGESMPVKNSSYHHVLCVFDLPSNTRVYLKVSDSAGQEVTLGDLVFSGWSIGHH